MVAVYGPGVTKPGMAVLYCVGDKIPFGMVDQAMVYEGTGLAGLKVRFKFIALFELVQVACVIVGEALGCGFTVTVTGVVLVTVVEPLLPVANNE